MAPIDSHFSRENAGRKTRATQVLTVTVVASVLMGFRAAVSYPQPGVDPNYAFACNYAAIHGERWGQEFVSNRGPYAWILYPVNVGNITGSWFLVQAIFVVMVGVIAS